jgi:1,2-phenylacetyl-CoA epoxidase catalytic subunit
MSKILDEVIQDFRNREERGFKKYGVTMDRDDLLSHEWIQHLIEELQDAILYLKKIQTLQNGTQRHTDYQEANSGNVEQARSSGEIINP